MFYNISNHPSDKWGEKQYSEALRLGNKIIDIPFPNIDPKWIPYKVELEMLRILPLNELTNNDIVLIQGEFTGTYFAVRTIQNMDNNIKIVAATSERRTLEKVVPDGTTVKETYFEFIQFREYSKCF